jgi:hypothetical protein
MRAELERKEEALQLKNKQKDEASAPRPYRSPYATPYCSSRTRPAPPQTAVRARLRGAASAGWAGAVWAVALTVGAARGVSD